MSTIVKKSIPKLTTENTKQKKRKELDSNFALFVKAHPTLKFIYGGKTEKTLKDRHQEHKNEEAEHYKGTKCKLILSCSHLKDKEPDDAIAELNYLETHLIKLIKKIYPAEIIRNERQGGGGRPAHNTGDMQKLYIIYK
jgi:hypothetical protein